MWDALLPAASSVSGAVGVFLGVLTLVGVGAAVFWVIQNAASGK
jgi:hypothetical protein